MNLELLKTFVEYHVAMSRLVWESIGHLTDEQFVAEDAYSRGSIRNLMIHLASTDRRWLAGLKNEADLAHLRFDDYPTRAVARKVFESVASDITEYVNSLSEDDVRQRANDMPWARGEILLHLVNHGTDHRATVLQRLHEFGAPTFDQDFILWIGSKA